MVSPTPHWVVVEGKTVKRRENVSKFYQIKCNRHGTL
jgi:hypothetical protein